MNGSSFDRPLKVINNNVSDSEAIDAWRPAQHSCQHLVGIDGQVMLAGDADDPHSRSSGYKPVGLFGLTSTIVWR